MSASARSRLSFGQPGTWSYSVWDKLDNLNENLDDYPVFSYLEGVTKIPKIYIAISLFVFGLLFIFYGLATSVVCSVVGLILPLYHTLSTLDDSSMSARKHILAYWLCYLLFLCLSPVVDTCLSWAPFYYPIKLLFLFYLYSPSWEGASVIYSLMVRPALAPAAPSYAHASQSMDGLVGMGMQTVRAYAGSGYGTMLMRIRKTCLQWIRKQEDSRRIRRMAREAAAEAAKEREAREVEARERVAASLERERERRVHRLEEDALASKQRSNADSDVSALEGVHDEGMGESYADATAPAMPLTGGGGNAPALDLSSPLNARAGSHANPAAAPGGADIDIAEFLRRRREKPLMTFKQAQAQAQALALGQKPCDSPRTAAAEAKAAEEWHARASERPPQGANLSPLKMLGLGKGYSVGGARAPKWTGGRAREHDAMEEDHGRSHEAEAVHHGAAAAGDSSGCDTSGLAVTIDTELRRLSMLPSENSGDHSRAADVGGNTAGVPPVKGEKESSSAVDGGFLSPALADVCVANAEESEGEEGARAEEMAMRAISDAAALDEAGAPTLSLLRRSSRTRARASAEAVVEEGSSAALRASVRVTRARMQAAGEGSV